MAFICCPECGKEVSDRIQSCPNCGYPVSDFVITDNLKKSVSQIMEKGFVCDQYDAEGELKALKPENKPVKSYEGNLGTLEKIWKPEDFERKKKYNDKSGTTVALALLVVLAFVHPYFSFLAYFFYKTCEFIFYKSKKFKIMKKQASRLVKNCNELNDHIDKLQKTEFIYNSTDYGSAKYYDNSAYKFSRPEFYRHAQSKRVFHCSRTVCDNARLRPFKYVCKYFGLPENEKTLERVENLLNNYEAAENGKILLEKEKERILIAITQVVPFYIRKFGMKRFKKKLGFYDVALNDSYFPSFTFQYVSPGGNASLKCEIKMDIDNLNRFILYLSETIKFRNSVAGQRALMTSSFRKKILERDGYKCQKCGTSIDQEPHLLLEVDHIIPLSKGGTTEERNLQTLCWKCNRSKGTKIER